MNLNDLAFVVNSTLDAVSENDLTGKYQTLINSISTQQSNPSSENEMQILISKNVVVSAHKRVNSNDWTFARRNLFEKLHCDELLGPVAIRFIERTYRNIGMTQTAVQNLQSRIDQMNSIIQRLGQIKAGLGDSANFNESEIPNGSIYVEIVFKGGVSISSVSQLKEAQDEWTKVFQYYNRILSRPEEDVQIVYLSKNSPIIEGLIVSAKVAGLLAATLVPLIKIRSDWLKSQILAEKLSKLQSGKNYLKRDWRKAYEKMIEKKISEIVLKIIKEHKTPQGTTEEEVTSFIKRNTEFISKFTQSGGQIDMSANKKGGFTAKLKLASSFKKMNILEEKVMALLETPKLVAKRK